MTTQQFETQSSAPASVDLSTYQWCAVSKNSSGQLAVATAGAVPDGVLQNPDATLGKQGRFAWIGQLKVKYGGTVAAGANLAVGANGTFVTATTGNAIIGKADVAGTTGQLGRIIYGYRGVSP